MRAASYLRVSTTDQLQTTRSASCAPLPSEWDTTRSRSTPTTASAAMGRDKRPAFDRLHRDAARRNNMAILYEARGESGSGLPNAVRRYLTIIPDFASLIRATRITTRYHFRSFV